MKNKSIKYNIIIIFVIISVIIGCGLPSLRQYDDLNAPTNLQIIEDNDTEINISFTCYNYETNFKGYNIYIVDESDEDLNVTNLSSVVNNHIITGNDGFLEVSNEVEEKYIIKDSENTLPTIKAEDVLNYYNNNYAGTDKLENLYDKTESCYDENDELVYDIGDINEDGEVCNYKLKPFDYSYEISYMPDSSLISTTLTNYKIVVSAYDNEYFVESNPSNQVSTSE